MATWHKKAERCEQVVVDVLSAEDSEETSDCDSGTSGPSVVSSEVTTPSSEV